MKKLLLLSLFALALTCVPAESLAQQKSVLVNATQSDISTEQILRDPEGFLKERIRQCDALSRKIKAYEVDFLRLKTKVERKLADSHSIVKRYTNWLEQAKSAYKKVQNGDAKWPINITGIDISEDEFKDLVSDALERLDFAKKAIAKNELLAKKIKVRQNVLKTRSRELTTSRRQLSQQLEDLKLNQELGELDSLKSAINLLKDVSLELAEDPTKITLDDVAPDDSKDRHQSADEFLNS